MRHIVLDTETTGLHPKSGHRVVEIGCVELYNYIPTGKTFHTYLNPDRDMPEPAFKVHGLSEAFLRNHPRFKEQCQAFLDFIQDDPLVIHNAPFDMRFLNAELSLIKKPRLLFERAVDTLVMAKEKFPGSLVNLDALCKRFGVSTEKRVKHGALLDAEILAEVYLELSGGRQSAFMDLKAKKKPTPSLVHRPYREPRNFPLTSQDKENHQKCLDEIQNPLWKKYL